MKRISSFIICLFVFLFSCGSIFAQDSDTLYEKVLFNDSTDVHGYLSLNFNFHTILDQPAFLITASGAFIIKEHVLLGATGGALVNKITVPEGISKDKELALSFGGISLGYLQPIGNKFQLSALVTAGKGIQSTIKVGADYPSLTDYDNIEVYLPEASVAYCFNENIILGAGAKYLLLRHTDIPSYGNSDFTSTGFFFYFKYFY